MSNFLKSNYHYIFIVLFAALCYHFLWYNPYSMKWDLSEQYLPWRHFTGKAVYNGVLPFWNPFQLGGIPSFADPQSSAWYYPAWFIGGVFGYTMKVIELEILGFIILGGLGFFALSKKIGNSTNSSFIVSLCYLSCGFFVGNAQHLTWIAAAAWIPCLFFHYLHIRKEQYNVHLIYFLLILYLFISSSYPAFVITAAYIIIVDQIILLCYSSNRKRFLLNKFLLATLSILAVLPFLYSLYISQAYFSRGDGVTLAKALQHPFAWQSLLSLIAPFSSFKNNELFNADISMSNAYMGLFPIILILFYFLFKKNKRSSFWLVLSFVFLLIGLGEQTPLRTLLYNHLPGFNLFRFPSLFRLFFIICILLFSASYYDSLRIYIDKYRSKIIITLSCIVAIFLLVIVFYIDAWKPFSIESLSKLSQQFEGSTFKQHLLYQLAFQSLLLIVFCILLYKKVSKSFLLLLICVDLFFSVRLNAMATIVLNVKTKDVDYLISNAEKTFKLPHLQAQKKSVDQQYEYRWPLNWNMNCYFGEIAIDGYNPFVLNTFNTLSESSIKDSVWENHWYYIPKEIIYKDSTPFIHSGIAWIQTQEQEPLKLSSKIKIENTFFSANKISFRYYADSTAAMVLAQNPFPGWRAHIDERPLEIYTANYSQQMVFLDAGTHDITWEYSNTVLNWLCYVHLSLFLALGLIACVKTFQRSL